MGEIRTIVWWEEPGVDMYLKETGCEGVERINLAQDRAQWRALVNTVMNFQAVEKAGNFLKS
jgi:hypothetical protein